MMYAPTTAAVMFCLATGNAVGQTDAYDWGQNASRAAHGQATLSGSYDWGQSAVNRGYYGGQPSSTSTTAKRLSLANSLGSISGENKALQSPSGSTRTAPEPTNSGVKIPVPRMDR
jgi:hypothetical protein